MIDNINSIFKNYTSYINGWENYKRASVTIPLVQKDNNIFILFEVRSKTLRYQPNEICFPGGKIENDETPIVTAIRETSEELGINESNINVISSLDIFISPFNILIHPFLIELNNIASINTNAEEVEKIFLVPLDYLLKTEPLAFTNSINMIPHNDFPYDLIPNKKQYKFNTGSYEVLFYNYDGYVIWGLTARILYNFMSVLKAKNYQIP